MKNLSAEKNEYGEKKMESCKKPQGKMHYQLSLCFLDISNYKKFHGNAQYISLQNCHHYFPKFTHLYTRSYSKNDLYNESRAIFQNRADPYL